MNGVILQRGINECRNHVALWRRMPLRLPHYSRDADGMLRTGVDEHKIATLNKDEHFRSASPPNQRRIKRRESVGGIRLGERGRTRQTCRHSGCLLSQYR